MKAGDKTIHKTISRILSCFYTPKPKSSLFSDELPLRAELFSSEQLKHHGKILANIHRLKSGRHNTLLLDRLSENERELLKVHHLLTDTFASGRRPVPAGDWLLDNFYLIEEHIQMAKRHFPKGYSRQLPHLLDGPSAGLPRVYDIAFETIAHGDGRVDPENLGIFVAAYQSVTPLELGELWAIPIMLRLALIENIRRVAARIAANRIDRNLAVYWADKMAKVAAEEPGNLILTVADMARSNPPMSCAFVAVFTQSLQSRTPVLTLPFTWVEQWLSGDGLTVEQLVGADMQQQAADQVSMSNSIESLRCLGSVDWREFVGKMSLVEQILNGDPVNAYDKMDFVTRDHYRHVVEKIAQDGSFSEAEVARQAVQLAQNSAVENGVGASTAHVGYYLIGKGREQLERNVGARPSPLERLRRIASRFALPLYVGSIFLAMAVFSEYFVLFAYLEGLQGWELVAVRILSLLGTSHLAVSLVNCFAMLLAAPKPLPRMDFSKGIPPELRTLVVVPVILENTENVEELVKSLEVRFLANRDEHLHFGLLTDFCDSATETRAEDESLLQLARHRIEELNQKYKTQKKDRFFLFHRPRLWNSQDRVWMGFERKRGKLSDLNQLLRGESNDRFSLVIGDTSILPEVKYVITLDSDTQLARESARQFVGTMAHPLNRPRYDEKQQRVIEGYGILQPRVAMSLSGTNRSLYARMYTSEWGIDPYTRSVSDVYQDLFGEGSFIGKGIYDVDIFERTLHGRFPDNRILSHDLLEGCYVRSGLLSDLQLFEEHPASYHTDVKRRRRWIRGDWQIAHWILPRVPGADMRLRKNPLSMLSRWKILDNLLRSLTAAALILLLLFGWTLLSHAYVWTLAVIGVILIPSFINSTLNLFQKPDDVTAGQHLISVINSAWRQFFLAVFTFACLPYEAFFSLDAIIRSSWRMSVSHRKLLEWNPSDRRDPNDRNSFTGACRTMWAAPCTAIVAMIAIVLSKPELLTVVAPILILWFTAPAIAWRLSGHLVRRREALTAAQIQFLRRSARKTWAFFETFIGPEDHWLPPDNYQEYPVAVVAHRTSPTNMGLALLANLSAYDFGILSGGRFIERTSNALDSMKSMKKFQGHFFNWYDTRSLEPLLPFYISSVDSGNLAGYLLTLRAGLLELSDQKIFDTRCFESLGDALEILVDAAASFPEISQSPQLAQLQDQLDFAIRFRPIALMAVRRCLSQLADSAAAVAAEAESMHIAEESPFMWWIHAFSKQCLDFLNELALFAPWMELPSCRNLCGDFPELDEIQTLRELSMLEAKLVPLILHKNNSGAVTETHGELRELQTLVTNASRHARERIALVKGLALQCDALSRMNYEFLYDKSRRLLSIGYNVDKLRMDSSYYDLLASEARFSTFVAIAQGQLPQESWFALSRLLTIASGEPILLSWSGSMFEYLMPLLVMPSYEHTLIDNTCRTAVDRQIEYGKSRRVPWGISECGYNAIDAHQNYQYRAFGVPGLGLKRGLADDLVIAPYASMLALMLAPEEACRNLARLASEGIEGRYGFYEAVDYTPSHLPRGQSNAVVRSFMAHHQGMSLLALESILLNCPMQKRFESDSSFQAAILLLQERIPKATAFYAYTTEVPEYHPAVGVSETPIRFFDSPDTPNPEVHLLSNGKYNVMITNAGGGYSHWNHLAVTRWNEDSVLDDKGMFCYIRDVDSGEVWSSAHQPMLKQSDLMEIIFSEGRAEFRRRDHDYETYTEIAVSPEDDIELRRVRITNRARIPRTIDVTSYAEVVLAPPAADALHPAFSNLFVQTEIIRHQNAILCTRRPRAQDEHEPWMFHLMAVHGEETGEVSYETDRVKFIGRGNTVSNPRAILGDDKGYPEKLQGNEGSVLDPIVAIRCRITLNPRKTATIDLVTGVGTTRETALGLVGKYQDRHIADRVFDLAWTHGQVLLRQLNASESDAQLYARLAGSILYANNSLRAAPDIILKNRRGQSGLWGYAISGDLPVVLLRIENPDNIELARQLIQAHAYWRLKGLSVDLVIWNEDHASYRQFLHDQINGLIASGIETNVADHPGGIFLRPGGQIAEEDRVLIQTVARAILSDRRGTLAEQLQGRITTKTAIPLLDTTLPPESVSPPIVPLPRNDLTFYNGLGGFTPDGREYVITTAPGYVTPAPWVNVLANPYFGTVVSESGSACTWSENAHEFRLSPWKNDPVCDSSGEAFYLRDEETGEFWSPTPLPCRGSTPYVARHGFGYSVFEHTEHGIRSEMWVYVALDASVKFTVIKIRNESDRTRRLSSTGYVEWVLGDLRSKTAMHVITEIDQNTGALFARNPYSTEFHKRTAFFDVDDMARTVTSDRSEFLGRSGTLCFPAALTRARLSGKVGAALDPCAAIQVNFELAAGQGREIVFRLGAGLNAADAGNLVNRFRGSTAPYATLDAVWKHWAYTLGAINLETPDKSLNLLANGWLLYQTLACRLWARNAEYQSGGAFGFRDQLQDVMALIHARPELVREHLLRCAARQFPEGDVQHWWHPPIGRGVRTHCSDDYLWLPFAVCRYVLSTGDTGVLNEIVPFLKGRPVKPEEDSYYDLPISSQETSSLYDHCVRSIQNGLKFGAHGLPLIGSGDWNDGMNLVGEHGKGESVWLGFFLYDVLMGFAGIACRQGDASFSERCMNEAKKLRRSIERNGWDGEWYRRAYFDDGSPLGSYVNPECRIDSIVQSWSVISGAGNQERSRTAMNSLYEQLVSPADRLVRLLTPPFDKSALNPGYIKGYVPGIRENGGQYTHAAIWAAMAFARQKDSRRAWELFTMINPVNHAGTPDEVAVYKVEPYVVAADVYAVQPHTGRGGWTWYTGSAAWMYRLIVESLLGAELEVDKLRLAPCIPADWEGFKLHYRYRETVYHIVVIQNPAENKEMSVSVDGVEQVDQTIPLVNDRKEHWAEVKIRQPMK